ncbi:HlyD family secretion protein [Pseudomonas syringae pv. maculicola]|uniref:HlyD family secretion protein n=1 Tax=Pseudomonas syringae pv. maculicola TaxID=59511 RepID=A0A3M2UMC2_PSEYM|nr:HlyD family secretion protein [Pseudomonas syringae pv. maculicola]
MLEGTDRLRDGAEVEVVNDSKDVPAGPGQKLQGKPDSKSEKSAVLGKVEKPNV